jgi:3-oxoacyl-[acyl-carrier-protein] synthase II
MKSEPIAVTGCGMVSALGAGVDDNWRRLLRGESGIRPIERFSTDGFRTKIAGCVDFLGLRANATLGKRAISMGDAAIDEAVAQAGLERTPFPGDFFIAPPTHDFDWHALIAAAQTGQVSTYPAIYQAVRGQPNADLAISTPTIAAHYAIRHGLRRPPTCVITACASGASAVQCAVEALRRGDCQVALAAGMDGIVRPEMIARFSLLSALSTANDPPHEACKPFSADRDGLVLSEGAAALVLETMRHAQRRAARTLAYVIGCGEAGDNFHRTRSTPTGEPIAMCMERALQDAGTTSAAVDYINAHGTGTPENDRMEYTGLRLLFGPRAIIPPTSAVKSMLGHSIHAAGIIEAVCCISTLRTQRLPPTINYRNPDPTIPLDVVPNHYRHAGVRTVLSNSFGFGGQNVSLVFGST